jgi:hypothetical protein
VLPALVLALAQALPAAGPSPEAHSAPAPGGPVRVVATASRDEVTVGETFVLELKAQGPEGASYTFPAEAETDAFELRTPPAPADEAPRPADATGTHTHRYEAAVFTLGRAEIPPIPVRYRLPDGTTGEAQSEAVSLKVASLLPKDEAEPKLADVRPPVPVRVGRAFWVGLAAAALLLGTLAWWLWKRRRGARAAPSAAPAPPAAPDAEAEAALAALAREGLPARGEHRAFYIRLTAIAKRYLERRLSAPVVEMTTAETLAFLRGHPQADGLHPVVRDVSEAADRIKFARGEGLAAEAERHLASVRGLVHTLEARLRPAEPPTAEGKAA